MRYFKMLLIVMFVAACGINLADPTSESSFSNQQPEEPEAPAWQSFTGKIYYSQPYNQGSAIYSVDGLTGTVKNEFPSVSNSYMPKVDDTDVIVFSSINSTSPFYSIQSYDTRIQSHAIILQLSKNLFFPTPTQSGHLIAYVISPTTVNSVDSLMYYDTINHTSTFLYEGASSNHFIKGPVWTNDASKIYFQLQVGTDYLNSTIKVIDITTKLDSDITSGAYPRLNFSSQKILYANNGGIYEYTISSGVIAEIVNMGEGSKANNPVYLEFESRIAFTALHNGLYKIHTINYNGTNLRRLELGNLDAVYLDWQL